MVWVILWLHCLGIGHFFIPLWHKGSDFFVLHSTPPRPEQMNLSVTMPICFLSPRMPDANQNHRPYPIRGRPCCSFDHVIDGTMCLFIHVGENIMKIVEWGIFEQINLTPSHIGCSSKNPLYMAYQFSVIYWISGTRYLNYQDEEHKYWYRIWYLPAKWTSGNFFGCFFLANLNSPVQGCSKSAWLKTNSFTL